MKTLRNFIYLDTSMLDGFLASLEGFVPSDVIEEKISEKSDKEIGADVKIIKAGLGKEKSTEKKKVFSITEESKFQILYESLEKEQMIQFLDAFDDGIWKDIKRGEILEVYGKVRLTKFHSMMIAFDGIIPIANLMESFGESMDDSQKKIISQIQSLKDFTKDENIPIIYETPLAPDKQFYSQLKKIYLRIPVSDLTDELTICGKVQTKIPKGSEYQTIGFMQDFFDSISKFTGDQNQELNHIKDNFSQNGLVEKLSGPLIVITPLAIYI